MISGGSNRTESEAKLFHNRDLRGQRGAPHGCLHGAAASLIKHPSQFTGPRLTGRPRRAAV